MRRGAGKEERGREEGKGRRGKGSTGEERREERWGGKGRTEEGRGREERGGEGNGVVKGAERGKNEQTVKRKTWINMGLTICLCLLHLKC